MPVPIPTGSVTFLFTDIEGSTQRWERHGDAMRSAVERHDAIVRRAIETNRGHTFKTVGDAFCAAFDDSADALAAAAAAQHELAKEGFADVGGLRIRIGVHSGQAVERNGDYFGPVVNRVARLMSIGHGGQVLISESVREQVSDRLPHDATLVDLGIRRLKDLTKPEHVWQLCGEGLATEFPPLGSLDELPNNLPLQATALLGRDEDLNALKRLIGEHRLVTITGAGGVGKTRVALQIAADLIERFADGVWFADISPITDPKLVASVVASALEINQASGQRVDELIAKRLKRKQVLLVIDNCEHLIDAVASLVGATLAAAPEVRILCTSRQALGITGESTYRLPSLSVPDADSALSAPDAMQYGSVAVFVDRAQHTGSGFALTDANAPIVADICRRLDGIPLAIELAAARVKILSIANLAQRLNQRFQILTGGSRTALPRQKTLAALIDWSFDLLVPDEQRLFMQLSVFAGGFSLDAAVSVCSINRDEIALLDLLMSLVDKSLVVADVHGERERFHLLESTRAYGQDKLKSMGDWESLTRRHAHSFCEFAQAADLRYATGSAFVWRANAEADLDNYRAALEWGITQGHDDVIGGTIAGLLGRLWRSGGLVAEGRYWIGFALKRIDENAHPSVAARLWRGFAHLSIAKAKVEAAERAVALYERVGDAKGLGWSLINLSFGLFQMGRIDEAAQSVEQARQSFQEAGDKLGLMSSVQQLASIADSRGDTATARRLNEEVIAGFRALGNETGGALALGNLGEIEFKEGHWSEAVRLAGEALAIHQRVKDQHNTTLCNLNLGVYRVALGDLDGARQAAMQALNLARELQGRSFVAIALQHLALIAALQGETQRASSLLGYVDALIEALGMERELTEQWGYDALMASLRRELSDVEIEKLAAEGAAWSEDQAVAAAAG